ncbi:IclR family transcriptional regulator [Mesobacillus harenae]|uniref:IclR family transcriptional regulator n=1 Tax=Mesobacillus harenae TaxID=2213203 RepID=UPI001580FBD0|nr:IclR family transcriptional regulator [Mesobacillus harenae]
MSEDNSMQTINRTIQVLKSFTSEVREQSLSSLHKDLGLSKSSLQRILNTLVLHGLLEKDNNRKTYKLGMELYYLGKLVEEHSHLISTVKPHLKSLRDRLGENVYLNVIENNQRKCIAFEEAKQLLMTISHVGQTSPLHAGASAKLLLAYLSQTEIEEYIIEKNLEVITEKTIADKSKLRDELKEIRANGYASSFGERVPGVFAASAPILSRDGQLIAGIAVSAPMVRVDDEVINTFIIAIKEVAAQISNEIRFQDALV